MDIQGRTSSGTLVGAAASAPGALYTQDFAARYEAMCLKGNVYMCANQSGVTSQAGLSGTTPVLALYNPANSGVYVSLLFAGAIEIVATATTHAVWLGSHQTTAAAKAVTAVGTISTSTRNALIGTSTQGGQAQACLAGTATTPIAIDILGALGTVAVTSWMQQVTYGKWYDGSVILTPDSAVSIQTGAASGSAGLLCNYIWREIAITALPQ